ncbi:MAG: hypothetical protein AAFR02_11910, partial [Pseudomonadota bacterium]
LNLPKISFFTRSRPLVFLTAKFSLTYAQAFRSVTADRMSGILDEAPIRRIYPNYNFKHFDRLKKQRRALP